MTYPSDCSIAVRRFTGAVADELAILCRPERRSLDTLHQAEAVYRQLAARLAAERAAFGDLTCETILLRDIRQDLPLLLSARAQVLADLGDDVRAPLPAFIQQAPVDQGTPFEITASAVIPSDRRHAAARNVAAASTCACTGCAQSGARLVSVGDQVSLHTTNVYGSGSDAFERVWDMLCTAERLLVDCGMDFRNVVRTWIHLRDIDRDYDALNTARREFFRQRGIEQRPASTGVQGIPFPAAHDCSMSLHAVKSPRPLDVTPMSTPSLNEAWMYGVDFSRGLKFADANKVTLYVSGTASIDEEGRTTHVGNFEAQAERMLDNISSLLGKQGASFSHLVSAVTYLKHPGDAAALRSICARRGFEGFPCALVTASLCRPDLLCETEAVAMLPLPSAEA